MSEKMFNLLHEPWILAMRQNGKLKELSIIEVLEKAHEYKCFAGELPTQDIAVMRLLLAILHTVLSRFDVEGNLNSIDSPVEALERWESFWRKGSFPIDIIKNYLSDYEERFYLFHPEYPFYQIPNIGKSTSYTAAKMNGEISESSNKVRLFPVRSGTSKSELCFSEAARWLLYVNSFDDTAAKPTEKGLPSTGAGWLGKLGLVTVVGSNLFETLMLNSVFLKDGSNDLWNEENPVWELEDAKRDERTEITVPNNLAQLYTLHSRRLFLKMEAQSVVGYELLGGDFFAKENAFIEQMTMWRNVTKGNSDKLEYNPRRHDPSKQLWREFSVLIGFGNNNRTPGVISWLKRLTEENIVLNNSYKIQIASVKYGDKDFFVDDTISDNIEFNHSLLSKFGEGWIIRIVNEIVTTEKMVDQLGKLARDISKSSGNSDGKSQMNEIKEQAYYQIDQYFRKWLIGIEPENNIDNMDEVCEAWWLNLQQMIRKLGNELVNKAGPQAFSGRYISDKNSKKEYLHSAPKAYNKFYMNTRSRESLNQMYKKED